MRQRSPRSAASTARRVERSKASESPILFGTSGWRGALGEEVSFPRLRVLVRSIADWVHQQDVGDEVLVGWDRRLASQEMAEMSAAILREAGLVPLLSGTSAPTPALTHALAKRNHAAGIVLTASHNPALDHGLKLFGKGGCAISDADARRIESIAVTRMHDDGPARVGAPQDRVDFVTRYCESLSELLDAEALSKSGVVVVYDAIHGTGAGVLDAVLASAGATVQTLRTNLDPTFGGGAPDPIPDRLEELARRTASAGPLVIGLSTDGDADRFGVVDGQGRVLSETQVIALLVDHLAGSGKIERGVALTVGTGSLVEKVATFHGLPVERHPVGFKHLSAAIASGRVDLAGEESGGFALAGSGRDKDGILVGCLLTNLVATSGENLEVHVDRLEARFGASACARTAMPRTRRIDRAFEELEARTPESVDGVMVKDVTRDGALRLGFVDGGFLMFRRSGTESMMRVYAEAQSQTELEQRLEAGRRLLDQETEEHSS
jgi:phosphoglucomutase